jgi:DNA-binding ferritin-like protein
MEKLMSMLKVIYENLHVLHRNVIGPVWFGDHETLGNYYEKIEEFKDDTIEIAISLGHQEPSLAKAVEDYESIGGYKPYSAVEAYELSRKYFTDLINAYEEVRKDLPEYISAKFDEYQYWLKKEADYKIARRLMK